MLITNIAAEMWAIERPRSPGHHAAKDQEGKLAHAGYYRNCYDHHVMMMMMIWYDDYSTIWWRHFYPDIWPLDPSDDLYISIQCDPGEANFTQIQSYHNPSIFSQWVKLVLLAGVMSTCLGGVFVGIRWRWGVEKWKWYCESIILRKSESDIVKV